MALSATAIMGSVNGTIIDPNNPSTPLPVTPGSTYTCLGNTNTIVLINLYNATDDITTFQGITATATGTYVSEVFSANVTAAVYEVDTGSGFGVVTLPFTLALGDLLKCTMTRTLDGVTDTVTISTA